MPDQHRCALAPFELAEDGKLEAVRASRFP